MDIEALKKRLQPQPISAVSFMGTVITMPSLTDVNELVAEVERLTEQVEDLESQNENLQIEHDVMFARIRDANSQYSPDEVSRLMDAEIRQAAEAVRPC